SKFINILILKLSVLLLLCLFLFHAKFGPNARVDARVNANAAQSGAAASPIDFNRDIRPILADKCWSCHGPDAAAKKIKLRLDSEKAATADLGRDRHAIVPGVVDRSQLARRITATHEAMRMPPVDSGRTLSPAKIDLL